MIPTRGTQERFAICELIERRGMGFTVAMFAPGGVSIQILGEVYLGRQIAELEMVAIKRVLKERMTKD